MKSASWYLKELNKRPSLYWEKRGEDFALQYFKEISRSIPAYSKFLKSKKTLVSKINSISDFKKIPLIDKNKYLKKYPYKDLFIDGVFSKKHWVISSTSGSTDEPFYFPRTDEQDLQYALTAELYLLTNFHIDKKTTLYINGFAMGVWIGGLFTYQAIKHVVSKDKYKLSIINPGINKTEILKAINKLGPFFDQIIIGGYPPFVKDLVDYCNENNPNWKKQSIKFIFSAEGFSEDFRDYIAFNSGLKNPYLDTLNHYGTVDIGTKSYETPISILIRKLALKNRELYTALFGDTYKLPTLTQYIPEHFYFEEVNKGLVCTARSGLPLVRYDLKDNGGIHNFDKILKICKDNGIDLLAEAKKVGISGTVWKIPFVYVFERSDMSVSFYGANIYPELVKKVVQNNIFNSFFTGKCTLEIKYTNKQNQSLFIHLELRKNITGDVELKNTLKTEIIKKLLMENSEYRNNYEQLGKKAIPKILFWAYENANYFKSNGKQKWVKR